MRDRRATAKQIERDVNAGVVRARDDDAPHRTPAVVTTIARRIARRRRTAAAPPHDQAGKPISTRGETAERARSTSPWRWSARRWPCCRRTRDEVKAELESTRRCSALRNVFLQAQLRQGARRQAAALAACGAFDRRIELNECAQTKEQWETAAADRPRKIHMLPQVHRWLVRRSPDIHALLAGRICAPKTPAELDQCTRRQAARAA